MAKNRNEVIKYLLLDQSRLASFVNLIKSHDISILNLSDNDFLNDIFRDSVYDENPVVIIASDSLGNILGWDIAIINSKKYLIKFLLKHPKYLINKIIIDYFRPRTNKRGVSSNLSEPDNDSEIEWPLFSHVNWGDNNPVIARHVDITVLENDRHSGIGKNLHKELENVLRKRRVHRIDACIHSRNTSSQVFHIKLGWAVVKKDNNWIYITKHLK